VIDVLNERIGYRHVLSGETDAKSLMPGWMPCAQNRIWKKTPLVRGASLESGFRSPD
jgi:hypothetical protein